MNQKDEHPMQPVSSGDQAAFARVQLSEAGESYRTQFSLLVSIVTVLTLADATLVGYAITTQLAGVLLIGCLFPIVILYVTNMVLKLTVPIVYAAVNIEHKFGGTNVDWLMSTFLSTMISCEYVAELKSIGSAPDLEERIARLRKVAVPLPGRGPKFVRIVLLLLALGQAIAPIVLSWHFGWRIL